jgi:hypothetical protein
MPTKIGPTTVGYQLAHAFYEYLERAIDLGAVVGPLGNMDMNPALKPVMDAMNRILAGGAVTIQVTQPGDPTIYAELSNLITEATKESNDINKAAGYYVTLIP